MLSTLRSSRYRRCVLILVAGLAVIAATTVPSQPAFAQPPDNVNARTDLYGDALPSGVIARLGTVRFRSSDGFYSLAYTPDGRFLVSGGRGAEVWDPATGKVVRRLGAELPEPHGPAAMSSDGKFVAVGGRGRDTDHSGAVFEVATGRRVYRFGNGKQSAFACFSPDGKILAVAGEEPNIELCDAASGKRLRLLRGHEPGNLLVANVQCMVFLPDSQTLISGGTDGTMRFWDVANGKEMRRIEASGTDCIVGRLAVSPDGALVASQGVIYGPQRLGMDDTRIHVWNAVSGKEVRPIVVPGRLWSKDLRTGPGFIAFTPDGKGIVTGGSDGVLRVWDPETGKRRAG